MILDRRSHGHCGELHGEGIVGFEVGDCHRQVEARQDGAHEEGLDDEVVVREPVDVVVGKRVDVVVGKRVDDVVVGKRVGVFVGD